MRESLRTYLSSSIKKPRFWIGVILLLLFSFVFDISVALIVTGKSIVSGQWNIYLLSLGFFYAVFNFYTNRYGGQYRSDFIKLRRLVWIIMAVWAFVLYRFWIGLYFIATITFLTRILRWVLGRIFKKEMQPRFVGA